jgi:hypothetical protein
MKRWDIDQKLKAAGWVITAGKKHDMANIPTGRELKYPFQDTKK